MRRSSKSNKSPANRKRNSSAVNNFVNSVVSNSDIFVLYISGLLVVIGALLMLSTRQFGFWQQFTLASLILAGFFASSSVIFALRIPSPSEIGSKMDSRKATCLLHFSFMYLAFSWVLILFSTVALIVLIAIA